ncbi:MAG: hypothetical protein FJ335_14085 [Sphingomonadales bacterium]|nr:hypothetical protein [Sphingomonadales bacterium]
MPYLANVLQNDDLPFRPLTRMLAEMQTSINAAGLRLFDGDIDRFVIFALVVREGLSTGAVPRPISAHSLSISLNRSFETVRRHVNALIEAGYCQRVKGGVIATPGIVERDDVRGMVRLANDAFVRFVEDFQGSARIARDSIPPARPYDIAIGVCGAVDIMLSTVDSNRGQHGDWLDLTIFSTVLCANFRRYASDGQALGRTMSDRHAVRPSVIARTLGLAETTVRRRTARLTAPGHALVQLRGGLLVSQAWLATASAAATTARTLESVRREIRKAVLRGFPIDAPATAYLDGRPPFASFV